MNTNLLTLLKRTNIIIPFEKILRKLVLLYPQINQITSFTPIMEGYEDANIYLETDSGKYVVKFFSKTRSKASVDSYVKVLEECERINFPTVRMLESETGYLGIIKSENSTYFIITHFFDGESFESKTPTLQECAELASHLANLNRLNFPVAEDYDSWGSKNLPNELKKLENKLDLEVKQIVEPIAAKLRQIPWDNLPNVVINGDLQRKHVLKNKKGEYCVLDFGTMSSSPIAVEIAIYLAWFCLQPDTWDNRKEIITSVIVEYRRVHELLEQDFVAIDALIGGAYAAYYMKTHQLIKEGDTSRETQDWYEKSKKMLELYQPHQGKLI